MTSDGSASVIPARGRGHTGLVTLHVRCRVRFLWVLSATLTGAQGTSAALGQGPFNWECQTRTPRAGCSCPCPPGSSELGAVHPPWLSSRLSERHPLRSTL